MSTRKATSLTKDTEGPLDNSVVALCALVRLPIIVTARYVQTFTNTREYEKDPAVLITTTTSIASNSDQLFYVVTSGINFIRRSR